MLNRFERKRISAMNCKKRYLLSLLLLLAPGIGPATASPYLSLPANECDVANVPLTTNACSSLVGANGAVGSVAPGNGVNYVGARSLSLSMANTAIHAFGYCFYVNNQSVESLFVPFNSAFEITAFYNKYATSLSGINLIDCSVPGQVMVPPNFPGVPQANQCLNNPSSLPVNVPNYAPYATAASATATSTGSPATPFACISSDGTSFTETATATFGQQDSYDPVTQVGWVPSTVVYTYNGVCGSANGVPSVNAPATDLCHVGIALIAPAQDASGNWGWTCYGGNGLNSQNASCSAVGSVDGQCNSATTSTPATTAPSANLCSAGTPTTVTGGAVPPAPTGNPWTWSCVGTGNGTTASCSEPFAATPTDGQCDPATSGVATPTAPSGNLCSVGTPSSISGGQNGTPWSWTCAGLNGGKTANCAAPNSGTSVDGACDTTTESIATNTAPTGNLCMAGTPMGAFGGSGGSNWTWGCDGTNGGANAACSAPWVGLSCTFTNPFATMQVTVHLDGTTWSVKSNPSNHKNLSKHTLNTYKCENGVVVLLSSQQVVSCFPPDTPVLTANQGWQPISHIKRGDKVVSFDAKGNKTTAEVKNIKITPDQPIRMVNGSIRLSHSQEVQVATGAWKDAKDLKLGEALIDTDGKPHKIISLADEPKKITVYNLIMADHNIPFFAAGIRVKDWKGTDPERRK